MKKLFITAIAAFGLFMAEAQLKNTSTKSDNNNKTGFWSIHH